MLDFFPRPYERMHADVWIQSNQIMPNKLRNLAICVNGIAIGSIGVHHFSAEPNLRHNFKIGYFIDEDFWGKGVASEALKLMKGWVFSKKFAELANYGTRARGVTMHRRLTVRSKKKKRGVCSALGGQSVFL